MFETKRKDLFKQHDICRKAKVHNICIIMRFVKIVNCKITAFLQIVLKSEIH